MCMRAHIPSRPECEWCPRKHVLSQVLGLKVSVLYGRPPHLPSTPWLWGYAQRHCAFKPLILTTPGNISGVLFAQYQFMGCTAVAFHQGACGEGSSVGGSWWATGGWIQTGSRLTGLKSQGTCRSPAGKSQTTVVSEQAECCLIFR